MSVSIKSIVDEINRLPDFDQFGTVSSVLGMLIEVDGIDGLLSIGDRCWIITKKTKNLMCQVIGFKNNKALVMPYGALEGISLGCKVLIDPHEPVIYPHVSWLGRVINAFGEPIDDKGPLLKGTKPCLIQNNPPEAHKRQRLGDKIDLGVRVMNSFLSLCKGQRMGIFAGSGVGKSTLLSMMARHTTADVNLIGLIGERGREAREFIEDDLGERGMERSVVVVATSDEPPLVRRQAAYLTMAVAEYFRDQNNDVLCLMDSVTRFAMAQREISLSMGEPPATRGYTPTVFAELPRLLERAGPGVLDQGTITGIFSVLVEGDDYNEPISDSVRGIIDGHVILDRAIAERGRYPAVNILKSVSRTLPDCNSNEQNKIIERAKKLVSIYEDMAELIRLGAYREGSDPKVDEAIHYYESIEGFISQRKNEYTSLDDCYSNLASILDLVYEPEALSKNINELPKPSG